jgi:ribosomal protein S12 methylthiotransferase accessory factor
MEVKRKKKYKARNPIETINFIRNTLHTQLGILMKEEHFKDDNSLFYSCRISICNEGLEDFNLGCNGKGMSIEYALASAYGEFMERIQNNLIFMHQDFAKSNFLELIKSKHSYFYEKLKKDNLILSFNYAPDEKQANSDEESIEKIKSYTYSEKDDSLYSEVFKGKPMTLLPFYSLKNKAIEYLPIELIIHNCTSNGMCAGNTAKECLIQGVNEILERYVIKLIYKENLTPPTIPIDIFKGNKIYDNIKELEETLGLTIEVKDCSCGLNIPAIGVLIYDETKTKHQFHIGVDPSPITALERSLTETFQGRTDILFHNIDIPYQTRLLSDISLKEKELFKTYVDSEGIFPISLLSKDFSYEFFGFNDNIGDSDENDLTYLLRLISELGYDTYIRDVSYLGFPSYHVYVPGMSEIKNVFTKEHFKKQFYKTRNYFLTAHNLNDASDDQIKDLFKYIQWSEKNMNVMKFFNTKDSLNSMNQDLLYAMLHIRIKDFETAIGYLNNYIEIIQDSESLFFYKCLRDVVFTKIAGNTETSISFLYPQSMLDTVSKFIDSENVLEHLNISSCFNCDKCKIYNSCKFFTFLHYTKKVEDCFRVKTLNQLNIEKILYN